jgi:hypothetical protein
LYGPEISSVALEEQQCENRVLKGILGSRGRLEQEDGKIYNMGSFIICTHLQILSELSNKNG